MPTNDELYDGTDAWRQMRFQIIEAHYEKQHFAGKTVLEVAAAWGHIGAHFANVYGATVTCTDHYPGWVDIIKERHPNITALVQNLNDPWPFTQHFDVLIHMGVIYHQPKDLVEVRLREALAACDEVILETTVELYNDDPYHIAPVPRPPAEDAWEPMEFMTEYCRPSVACINRILKDAGMTVTAIQYTPTSWAEDYAEARFLWFGKR